MRKSLADPIVAGLALAGLAASAQAQTIGFDDMPAGGAPAGWTCGSTGGGAPRWSVEADAGAVSPPNILKQSGAAPFPWCVKQGASFADGAVEVTFKSLAGREDRAGGVMWRWKDGDTYYVARANALENNVSLYYTLRGERHTIAYVDAPVPGNVWHTLRAEFKGSGIRILLDGKAYIDRDDDHIAGAGAVGVWTKADSVTAFDDFRYESAP